MNQIKNFIPNTVTLLNLLSGTIAVIFAFSPDEMFSLCGYSLQGWQCASLMIVLAAVFDFCDGLVARLLHAKSEIGKELDSLCDMVSFGVAPAMMLMNVLLAAGAGWVSYISLFIPLMGALRLAKFNVDTTQTTSFKGLPIPSNAIFWIGFVSAMYQGLSLRVSVIAAVIVAISLLMVCRLPMFSLKIANLKLRENFRQYLLLLATVVSLVFFGVAGLAVVILFYIALSFLSSIIKISYE